jgi:hypothetical protein
MQSNTMGGDNHANDDLVWSKPVVVWFWLQLHSVDMKAEESACASGRACAASHPVQVEAALCTSCTW